MNIFVNEWCEKPLVNCQQIRLIMYIQDTLAHTTNSTPYARFAQKFIYMYCIHTIFPNGEREHQVAALYVIILCFVFVCVCVRPVGTIGARYITEMGSHRFAKVCAMFVYIYKEIFFLSSFSLARLGEPKVKKKRLCVYIEWFWSWWWLNVYVAKPMTNKQAKKKQPFSLVIFSLADWMEGE